MQCTTLLLSNVTTAVFTSHSPKGRFVGTQKMPILSSLSQLMYSEEQQCSNKGGSDSAWYNLKQKKINFISEFLNFMLKFILPSYVKFDYFYILCVFSTLRAPASYIHWSGFFQHVYEFWCDWCWSWQFIYLSCVFLNTFFTWWN